MNLLRQIDYQGRWDGEGEQGWRRAEQGVDGAGGTGQSFMGRGRENQVQEGVGFVGARAAEH